MVTFDQRGVQLIVVLFGSTKNQIMSIEHSFSLPLINVYSCVSHDDVNDIGTERTN